MCKRIFKEQTSTDGDIPFYKIGTFGAEPDAFISRELFEEYREKFQYPNIGDMLISASGTIGRTVEYKGEEAYFQDSNIVWFKHDDRVDNSFLKCIYEIVKWSGIEGSTIKRLYNDNFLKTEFSIPKITEQQQIGMYFQCLDHLITLHQCKCHLLLKLLHNDWEQRKLGETCKLNGRIGFRGYTERDIVTKEAGGVLTFSPTNIVNNKLTMECKNTYITREKYDESPEIKISNGDILFVKTGSTLGKSALVTGLKEDASINPQIVVMHVEKDSETFMSNVLITHGIMKQVAAVKIGGAVPTMTETELKNLTYFAPVEKEEQKRIGDYFTNLDHFITLHQRKCEETKKLKKYMLQKMFPQNGQTVPEIRFSGFTDAWEQRKLNEYFNVSTAKNKDNHYGKEDVLSVSGDYGIVNQIKFQGRSFAGATVANYGVVNTGDVVYTKSPLSTNPYGIIKANKGKAGIVSTLYAVYKPCKNVNSEFVQVYFELNSRMNNYMQPLVNKGAKNDMKITAENALKGGVCFPKLNEQDVIVEYFRSLDHLITLHQHKCEQLQSMKKFMLQNMFV